MKPTTSMRDRDYIWHPLTQEGLEDVPIAIASAKGLRLFGEDGKEYWDMISSWWVTTHGHAHPVIAQAIAQQAQNLEQVIFANFTHKPAVDLAEALIAKMPSSLRKVFFSDNGSTAVEVALKMAYQYWQNRGESKRRRLVSFEGSYHGETLGAMSLGRSKVYSGPFDALLFDVEKIPFPDTWLGDEAVEEKESQAIQAFQDLLNRCGDDVAAIIFEPLIQGAAGMRMCRPCVMKRFVEMAQQAGILVIFDEIMVGFGRTGSLFAHQKIDVSPDIICLSKGLSGGFLPLSVTITSQAIYDAFYSQDRSKMFAHSHSFTANPIACAAALASLSLFDTEKTLDRISEIEAVHQQRIQDMARLPHVCRTRVMGTIAAWDLEVQDSGYYAAVGLKLKRTFFELGLLIRPLGNTIYLMPPYCITDAELNEAYDSISTVLKSLSPV